MDCLKKRQESELTLSDSERGLMEEKGKCVI